MLLRRCVSSAVALEKRSLQLNRLPLRFIVGNKISGFRVEDVAHFDELHLKVFKVGAYFAFRYSFIP